MSYVGSLTVHLSSGIRFEIDYNDPASMGADKAKIEVIFMPQRTPMKIVLEDGDKTITLLSDAVVAFEEYRPA